MHQHTFRPGSLHRLTSLDQVEAVVGRPAAMIMRKQIGSLDAGCRAVLAHSPVAAFGHRDGDGTARTTFVGGRPGFARVHSPRRFSFTAPAPGVVPGPVSLFFLLPGVGEVLRVNGTASALRGETAVDVTEAYVHCAQAVIRAGLWEPPAPCRSAESAPDEGPLSGPGVGDFLAASPFLALSTWDADGGSDTSPRGERRPVARILDGRTLVLADRKGNRRADTLRNLLRDDRLSLAALVPGRSGVLHVHGRAAITDDAALLRTMALRGVPPHLALLIDVEYAEVHGNDAVAGARLWTPDGGAVDGRAARGRAPDMMALGSAHLAADAAESGRASARLIRLITAVPGVSRLMRNVIDRAYVSGLRKEGYDGVRVPVAAARGDAPGGEAVGSPLRPVRVHEIREETPSVRTLVLEDADGAAEPFDFRPGQFFTLVTDVGGSPVRRAYSASSVPGTTRLELTVKLVEGGLFSPHAHRRLRPGDRLAVRGPSGTFHARARTPEHLVLVAAGSGITPMMSMIRTRLSDPAPAGRIDLLYSSRRPEDIIFGAELTRMEKDCPDRLSVTHVLTTRDGRLDADGIHRWVTGLPPSEGTRHFVCGPEALMDTVQDVLRRLGVPDERTHRERFTGAATTALTAEAPQELSVETDGNLLGATVVEPGQTLLDAGLAAGLPMPYSCTVGNCGDCMARVRDGEVTQPEHTCLTPEQKAGGWVLTCVGCPVSAVALDISDPAVPDGIGRPERHGGDA
ncbi:2Fe-2S iron-sulfur cluster-binding protein [Streptomyces sp. NPDC018026]|uniref:2Fe-2S iron-sulfur cluster-binding protein n=1 Tax=Streptomyces sp. NPDC018026 TaxID=3365031 RepID=UPI00379E606C